MTPGSCDRAAEIVASKLLELGATNLAVKVGRHIASRGATCFESDSKVQSILKRWDGRAYHRESIGRVRRLMARRGWIGSVRVMPQEKPPGASFRSTHGTTSKHICWKALGVRNPLTKGERREARMKTKRTERETEQIVSKRRLRTHFVVDPTFTAMVEGIRTPSRPRRDEKPDDRERERQADAEARAAEARERLAEWVRDHEQRGPP